MEAKAKSISEKVRKLHYQNCREAGATEDLPVQYEQPSCGHAYSSIVYRNAIVSQPCWNVSRDTPIPSEPSVMPYGSKPKPTAPGNIALTYTCAVLSIWLGWIPAALAHLPRARSLFVSSSQTISHYYCRQVWEPLIIDDSSLQSRSA